MDSSEDEIGPMPAQPHEAGDVDGAQVFREREQRLAAMEEKKDSAPVKSMRPDWMTEMPEDFDGRPTAARAAAAPLRARGFHQGGRVQRAGGAPGGDTAEARRLWTESPAERQTRILQGDTKVAGDAQAEEAERLARERVAKRDAGVREQIKTMVGPVANSRIPSGRPV